MPYSSMQTPSVLMIATQWSAIVERNRGAGLPARCPRNCPCIESLCYDSSLAALENPTTHGSQ
jgi:hypothetical protein